jgi:hypothetical protein
MYYRLGIVTLSIVSRGKLSAGLMVLTQLRLHTRTRILVAVVAAAGPASSVPLPEDAFAPALPLAFVSAPPRKKSRLGQTLTLVHWHA